MSGTVVVANGTALHGVAADLARLLAEVQAALEPIPAGRIELHWGAGDVAAHVTSKLARRRRPPRR